MKQKLFHLLLESGIPPTDKIFPWVVETALTRIEIASLGAKLAQTDSNLASHPEQLKNTLALVLKPYLEEVGRTRIASDTLTKELRAAAIIDASIADSGWRGIGAALSAIFKHQNLRTVIGILVAMSLVLGFVIAWNYGGQNRLVMERNRQVIQECNTNRASDPDKNGWYTCPLWQLPMPQE
ncbi:MAG TPA: hypothetical protein V6D09_04190 [Leptolyngbyaceae cyanobacterium]